MSKVDNDHVPDDSGTNPVVQADIGMAEWAAQYRGHPIVRAAGPLSKLSDQPPLLAATAAVLAWGLLASNYRLARQGGHMFASVLLATALKNGLKKIVSRSRPNLLFDKGVYGVVPLGPDEGPWHSFPSGHTAGAVALARAVAREWPTASAAAYTGAAAVALLQIPRCAHYPADVLAGAFVGAVAQSIAERVFPPQ